MYSSKCTNPIGIAGYSGGNNQNSAAGQVWRRACESLLQRKDFNPPKPQSSYLKAICSFLMNVGSRGDLKDTLENNHLSLSDRVAFACIFLSRDELKEYLERTFYTCISPPNLEGILISGLNKRGIALIQSFVDARSDVQTAALVSCRVVLPPAWNKEKMICNGWLETYRQMVSVRGEFKMKALMWPISNTNDLEISSINGKCGSLELCLTWVGLNSYASLRIVNKLRNKSL